MSMHDGHVGFNCGVAQAAVALGLVINGVGWSERIIVPFVTLMAVYFHPLLAALLACVGVGLVSAWIPPLYFDAAAAGVLLGMSISPAATAAATIWAALAAALVCGAWYANLSLSWALPTAAVVAAMPATLVLRPTTKAKQSPSPPTPRLTKRHIVADQANFFL